MAEEKEMQAMGGQTPPPWMKLDEQDAAPLKNFLEQPNQWKWRYNPPVVMRGDAKEAFQAGFQAEKMKCQCWNKRCPFYGNCRKCIVFHMALKQFPTCQRAMLEEVYLSDFLDTDLHIKRDEAGNPIPDTTDYAKMAAEADAAAKAARAAAQAAEATKA